MLLIILMEKKLLEHFTKTNCRNQSKKNLELQKYSRENVINSILYGKSYNNSFNHCIDKKDNINE